MGNQDNQPSGPLFEPLTRREREILGLLAQGLSAPEIAEKLTLANSSVKWHIQQLYGKLGVNNKQKALVRAAALGLLAAPAAAGPGPLPVPPTLQPGLQTQPAPALFARHNLPPETTRFFGREVEIAQLKAQLAEQRLVTLTGSGGVGKTRLSLRAAEELLDDFPDGVWLVELAPLTSATLVAQQVAAVLGVRDSPSQTIQETLTAYLRERQMLLVLDNCEHLLETCARLAESFLRGAPRLKILASSREPLGVPGEVVFRIPQLAFPELGLALTLDGLGEYASVRLFIDRARLVLPGYQVTAADAPSLAYIVQRLDGIPLAIEMAAARLNLLSAVQLAGRLDDAFRVLTGGSRTALPRQQTLRATLDWSYRLLTSEERSLLQHLSVFAGGCTLEAAESVCADPAGNGLAAEDVLERLGGLVAKSMVIAVRKDGQEVRYHLLETVRQYAREKLQDAGEGARLRARQRDYFLALADARYASRDPADWPAAAARLRPEIDNLRLAIEWSFGDETVVEAVPRLVTNAGGMWPSYVEQNEWFKRAVAWTQGHPAVSPSVFAYLLVFGSAPLGQDDLQTSLAWLRQAVEISRGIASTDVEPLSLSLMMLSERLIEMEDLDSALAPFNEAEVLIQKFGSSGLAPKIYSLMLVSIAHTKADIAIMQGRYREAIGYALESIRINQEIGGRQTDWLTLVKLARARLNLREYDQARNDLLRALTISETETGYMRLNSESYLRRWLCEVEINAGDLEKAVEYCQASLRLSSQIPDYNIIASGLGLAAAIAAKRGQPRRAARLSGAAQAMYARQGRKPWEDSSLDTLFPAWRDGPEHEPIAQAFEKGQAMSAEQAAAYALET